MRTVNDLRAEFDIIDKILEPFIKIHRSKRERFSSFFSRSHTTISIPYHMMPSDVQQLIKNTIVLKSNIYDDHSNSLDKKTTEMKIKTNIAIAVEWFRVCYLNYFPMPSVIGFQLNLVCSIHEFTLLSGKDLNKLSKTRRNSLVSGIWKFGNLVISEKNLRRIFYA